MDELKLIKPIVFIFLSSYSKFFFSYFSWLSHVVITPPVNTLIPWCPKGNPYFDPLSSLYLKGGITKSFYILFGSKGPLFKGYKPYKWEMALDIARFTVVEWT